MTLEHGKSKAVDFSELLNEDLDLIVDYTPNNYATFGNTLREHLMAIDEELGLLKELN